MFVKILGRFILLPAAGVTMLAGLGVFDLGGEPSPGAARADMSSPQAAAQGVLSALEGPLAVAQRIAVAGSRQMGMSPADLPDFLSGQSSGGAAPAAAGRKTVAVPAAGSPAPAEGGARLSGGGAWKSSTPPPAPAD